MPTFMPMFSPSVQFTSNTSYTARISNSAVQILPTTLKITNAVGRRSTATLQVKTDIYTLFQQYQQISIQDGSGNLAFSGYITQPVTTKPGFASYLIHQLTCVDQHYLADKRVFYGSFTNRTAGVIVMAILNQILSKEGVAVGQIYDGLEPSSTLYPSTTLYPSGTGLIPSSTFYYNTVSQALDQLVTNAGISGTPYYWMIDQNKKLWFVPYTTVVNSTIVDGTQIEQIKYPPQITRANPTYRNTQYVTGGYTQTGSITETRQGDGKLTTWTMAFGLASAPTITVNGGARSVGIQGSGNAQYYWAVNSPVITQDNSQPKITSSDTLSITYVGQYPSTAIQSNYSQITAQAALDGTSGIIEQVTDDPSLSTGNDALTEASALINRYGNQGIQFQFTTLATGYAPGQLITVNYAPFGLSNQQMLIESVDIEDKDGINIWFTITTISGAFDTNWVSFFSKLLGYSVPQNAINAGSSVAFAAPIPSPTLYPSSQLYPG